MKKILFILFLFISIGSFAQINYTLTWQNALAWDIKPTNSEATNTTNVTAALDFIIAQGGGTLYFPFADSAYKIRIIIPVIDSAHWCSIKIVGASPPGEYYGTIGTGSLPIKGVILKSNSTTSTDAVIQCSSANLDLWLQNLDIRTYDSTRISGVDALDAAYFHMRDCYVNTNTYNVQAKAPALTNTYGVRTPQFGSGSAIELYNVAISGFYTGLIANEHTFAVYPNIFSCVRAIEFETGYHSIDIIRPCLSRNTYNLYVNGITHINVVNADIEHVGPGQFNPNTAWQQTAYDLYDNTNAATGAVTLWTILGNIGPDDFTKNGGAYISTGTTYIDHINSTKVYGLTITNPNSASIASTLYKNNSDSVFIGKIGTTVSPANNIAGNDFAIKNYGGGNMVLQNDNTSGAHVFGIGGSEYFRVNTSAITTTDQVNITGNVTNNYKLQVGSTFFLQPYQLNLVFWGDNAYWNGSAYTRPSSGYSELDWVSNGEKQIRLANSGSGTITEFNTYCQQKSYYDGTFATGFQLSNTVGDFTGAQFKVAGSTGIVTMSHYGAGTATFDASGNISSVSAPAIKYAHTIFTPTTGGTVSLINNQYNIINPAGALLALTVNLPSSPANNDVVYIKFTQTISTVTYANGTVVDGITAPTAGGLTVLTYDSGTTSWY